MASPDKTPPEQLGARFAAAGNAHPYNLPGINDDGTVSTSKTMAESVAPDPRKACRQCDYPEYVEQLQQELERQKQLTASWKTLSRVKGRGRAEAEAVVERLREALLEACDTLDAWHLQNPEDTARLRAVASPDKPPDRVDVQPTTRWDGHNHVTCYVCQWCANTYPHAHQLAEHIDTEHKPKQEATPTPPPTHRDS